jgi:hypothetical protein
VQCPTKKSLGQRTLRWKTWGRQYQVSYFAKKHGLKQSEAAEILKAAGKSKSRADALAELVKAGNPVVGDLQNVHFDLPLQVNRTSG